MDSDDEYDRKRRDKFRGERSAGESYRSDRRSDERRGREDWGERNRGRPDYYRGGVRDRYSPARDIPPPKRIRPDWGEDNRPRYPVHDPYALYGHALYDHYPIHTIPGYPPGHMPLPLAHGRDAQMQNANSDMQTQPPMLTLKQFLETQDDGISDSEVLEKYGEYKLEFKRQQLNEFFIAHKDEEWFKIKYHPEESKKRKEEQLGFLKKRVDVFCELLEKGMITSITIDSSQTEQLLRILDTVVIKLEGGTDDDLKILDEKPLLSGSDSFSKRADDDDDDDVIITDVKPKIKQEINEKELNWAPIPSKIQQLKQDKLQKDSDEENWDDDDVSSTAKATNKKDSDKSDNSSSSSSSSSSSEDEDDWDSPKKKKMINAKDVKKEKVDEDDWNSSKVKENMKKQNDNETEKEKQKENSENNDEQNVSSPPKNTATPTREQRANSESSNSSNESKKAEKPEEDNVKDKSDLSKDDEILDKSKETEQSVDDSQEEKLKSPLNNNDEEEEEEEHAKKTTKESEKIKSSNDVNRNEKPETIDLVEKENKETLSFSAFRPRALHRTSSIFLRNLAPAITKSEIETVCKRYDGYLRVAIADPLPERRWYRRGWVTFRRDVNIKEICWNLNNIRLRDCEMGAIVNRDLSRRVRSVNGITAHKPVVRNDIKLIAKACLNLDEKMNLWSEEDKKNNENTANDQNEKNGTATTTTTIAKTSSTGSFGFKSRNPVLQNITDYLIEEASAEEDELLGVSSDNAASEGEQLERDPQLISVLDKLIFYMRIVHSVDFYNHCEYPYEDEMPNRCGIIHARGPPPANKITKQEIEDYIKNFETKMSSFLTKPQQIQEDELKNLGAKDAEAEVEKFVQANTQELSKDKWLCPLSGKKFKGPEFIRKHIFNKHGDKVDEVRKEVEYFNNYLKDPKRPQLPEHPGNSKPKTGTDLGQQLPYRPGYPMPAYAPPYAAYAPPIIAPPRPRGFGNRRGPAARPMFQYRDLDAANEANDY